jgi:hypothetical protein
MQDVCGIQPLVPIAFTENGIQRICVSMSGLGVMKPRAEPPEILISQCHHWLACFRFRDPIVNIRAASILSQVISTSG